MKTKALLVILFLGCLPMCFAINTKKFELQVIDKITKEPVPNIVVYYQVTKIKPVGVVDGKFTPVVQEKLITDGKGCIVIERKKLSLGFFEFLMFEDLYINIESSKGNSITEMIKELDGYFRGPQPESQYHGIFFPNQKYNPVRLHIDRSEKGKMDNIKDDIFISTPIDYTMKNKPNRIIVELSRRA